MITSFRSPFCEILSHLDKQKALLDTYPIAVQTVKSIALLELHQNRFARENLTADVKDLTGLEIHAQENYPDVERFQLAVTFAVRSLEQAFAAAKTDHDKLMFFRNGLGANLTANSCFEARTEAIFNYYDQTQSLTGLLRFEINDLNRQKNDLPETPVKLDELMTFLKSEDFFKKHLIEESSFNQSIQELQKLNLISSGIPTDLMTSIEEALSLYEDFGKGIKVFENYLHKQPAFSGWDRQELVLQVKKYFTVYPERQAFI